MEKTTLSIREAATRLGISAATAYRAADREELPTIRFGRRRLVPVEALRRMLESAEQPKDRAAENPHRAAR